MKKQDALNICPRCGHVHDHPMVKYMAEAQLNWVFVKNPKVSMHRRCDNCGGTWEVQLELGQATVIVQQS